MKKLVLLIVSLLVVSPIFGGLTMVQRLQFNRFLSDEIIAKSTDRLIQESQKLHELMDTVCSSVLDNESFDESLRQTNDELKVLYTCIRQAIARRREMGNMLMLADNELNKRFLPDSTTLHQQIMYELAVLQADYRRLYEKLFMQRGAQ